MDLFRHEIQRLENDEREAERDLRRLNRDRVRASRSSLSHKPASIRQNSSLSRSNTPCFSIVLDSGSVIDAIPTTTKVSPRRPLSINIQRISDDFPHSRRTSTPFINEKFPRTCREIHPKSNEIPPHLRKHANSINRQKREIEQKLKEFLH